LPRPSSNPDEIEVVLSAPAANLTHIEVGDQFVGGYAFDDCNRPPPTDDPVEAQARARFRCVPQAFVTMSAPFTVVGIVEADDIEDPYWTVGSYTFQRPDLPEGTGPTIAFLLPEQTFHDALPQLLTRLPSVYQYATIADLSRIDSGNIEDARASLARLRERAGDEGFIADLAMASPLQEFSQRASFNQVTLVLLLLQVVGIAIYYVILVSSLLVERRAEEVAMLRSRGATVTQVVTISFFEAALLGIAAALLAPFLAAAIVSLLGKTGTFESVSGGSLLDYVLVPQAFLFALGGAALAVIAVLIPSYFGARRGLIFFLRSASRPGAPLFQRYYIDFVLVGLAALGLWELNQRGSVFDPRSVGGWSADPLLLLSPLLLILAVGALLFRFLPLVLSVVARGVALTAGPGVTLGVWQLTRSPSRYTQLALLVVMAVAVGTFAATYSATTDRSKEEQARFQAGADVRTTGLAELGNASPEAIRAALNDIPGVQESAGAYRGSLTMGFGSGGAQVPVLAIDPEVASTLLWFRDDFARDDLGTMVRRLSGSPAGGVGLLLPGEPSGVSLWALADNLLRHDLTLWLRTLDSSGVFRLHELGRVGTDGYQRFETRFTANERIAYPVSIAGLIFTQGPSSDPTRGSLVIDDISTIEADGSEVLVEGFEGALRWDQIRTSTRSRDLVHQSTANAHSGSAAGSFDFRSGSSVQMRGMYVSDPNIPLPAIASARWLEHMGIPVGGEIELSLGSVVVPLLVQSAADLFPSLPDSDEGFIIVNQRHLYYYAGLTNQSSPRGPNEAWLRLSDDQRQRTVALREIEERHNILAAQIIDVQRAIELTGTDPIVKAGGSGILLIALIAAFAVLALGFVLTLYLGGQQRNVEVSVLRAVGLSSRQVLTMITLEYLLIAVIGLVVGTLAGLRISETMLSFLNVTEEGNRVVPPFELVTRWDTVAVAFGATAVAFMAGVLALATYFLRLPVSRILRLTR
jgi:ABC-type lipoprotein release transport system permease subunit